MSETTTVAKRDPASFMFWIYSKALDTQLVQVMSRQYFYSVPTKVFVIDY